MSTKVSKNTQRNNHIIKKTSKANNDKKRFMIAVGLSARSTAWKNKKMSWREFKDKIKKPVVTNETFAEYQASSREEKGKIKDVGGFVGGYLTAMLICKTT